MATMLKLRHGPSGHPRRCPGEPARTGCRSRRCTNAIGTGLDDTRPRRAARTARAFLRRCRVRRYQRLGSVPRVVTSDRGQHEAIAKFSSSAPGSVGSSLACSQRASCVCLWQHSATAAWSIVDASVRSHRAGAFAPYNIADGILRVVTAAFSSGSRGSSIGQSNKPSLTAR